MPTSPTLRITGVSVKPAGSALGVTVAVRVDGPLGLRVPATVDVTGTPVLGPGGRIVTLRNVTVRTRREGLTGRVIGWLADARAQAFVSRMARFDLGPKLTQAQAQLQGRLPYSPTPGSPCPARWEPCSSRAFRSGRTPWR
ncbi:DUF4403 family protein [Deinococcus malanensis]|uniref:DUF4403 family protein n=1 Tax=Deinococcus malanensis TaxID=1706855 RepID=UPI00362C4874